jgi:hypothetical protein
VSGLCPTEHPTAFPATIGDFAVSGHKFGRFSALASDLSGISAKYEYPDAKEQERIGTKPRMNRRDCAKRDTIGSDEDLPQCVTGLFPSYLKVGWKASYLRAGDDMKPLWILVLALICIVGNPGQIQTPPQTPTNGNTQVQKDKEKPAKHSKPSNKKSGDPKITSSQAAATAAAAKSPSAPK